MTKYTTKQRHAVIRANQLVEIAAEIAKDAGLEWLDNDLRAQAATIRAFHKDALDACK